MEMRTECVINSIRGKVRKNNQDNFYLNGYVKEIEISDYTRKEEFFDDIQCFAVCDGMGGEQRGEMASYLAVRAMQTAEKNHVSDLKDFIYKANDKICNFQSDHQVQCGTTFVGLHLNKWACNIANVGDSRAYYVHGGQIRLISKDHTEYQMYLDAGIISEKDAYKPSARHTLTQHLGILPSIMQIDPYIVNLSVIYPDDVFLLCSDGVHGVLNEKELLELVYFSADISECCENLVRTAEKKGSRDNITAMLVKVH